MNQFNGFYFSASQRKSISILLLLIMMVWGAKTYLPKSSHSQILADDRYAVEVAEYLQSLEKPSTLLDSMIPFDVNAATVDELISYGLPRGNAETWINYGKTIGGFRNQNQIRSIYHIDTSWLRKNEAYFVFPKKHPAKVSTAPKQVWRTDSFDPNNVDATELVEWGFSQFASNNLEKFREKGGKFDRPEDVSQIFGVTPELFNRIRPLIQIESPPSPPKTSNFTRDTTFVAKEKVTIIDVNEASVYQWQLLHGIGPGYAGRIVKFRDALGGFISIDQIRQTYGLPDTVFMKIRAQLNLTKKINKIDINSVDKAALAKHPYISRKKAGILINYRNNHGYFDGPKDLFEIRIFDSTEISRLTPYLDFTSSQVEDKKSQ